MHYKNFSCSDSLSSFSNVPYPGAFPGSCGVFLLSSSATWTHTVLLFMTIVVANTSWILNATTLSNTQFFSSIICTVEHMDAVNDNEELDIYDMSDEEQD